jgi:hypothetical protein
MTWMLLSNVDGHCLATVPASEDVCATTALLTDLSREAVRCENSENNENGLAQQVFAHMRPRRSTGAAEPDSDFEEMRYASSTRRHQGASRGSIPDGPVLSRGVGTTAGDRLRSSERPEYVLRDPW